MMLPQRGDVAPTGSARRRARPAADARHVRRAVRESRASDARFHAPKKGTGGGPGVSSAATQLPGLRRSEGGRSSVKRGGEPTGCGSRWLPGSRDMECDVRLSSRETAPSCVEDMGQLQTAKNLEDLKATVYYK